MADCSLTARQKDMIRSLVSGLKDGTVETEWIIAYGGGKIEAIFGLDDQGVLWRSVWDGVTWADFDEFVGCGYFRQKSNGGYTLRVQPILDAVENNFGEKANNQEHMNTERTINVSPIFGLPVMTKQFQCDVFMVMPFRDPFHTIYSDHIKPVVESLNVEVKLGDNFFSKHEIMTEIWSAIFNSKLLIADCTGKNPNVFYELGIAHTLGRPAIMITQNIDDIPFDVRGKRAIVYEYTSRGMKELEIKLKSAIESLLNDGEG